MFWTSEEGDTTFMLLPESPPKNPNLILGDSETVQKCARSNFNYLYNEGQPGNRVFYDTFLDNSNVAVTYGKEPTARVVTALSDSNERNGSLQTYTTETRIGESGIERRTVSDFGLLSSIIAQMSDE
jgi:hypothetical protein